ncbi:MAG: hypothetical protein HDR19_06550 [Lachnospiraceae bacterium]|nr:hypothetical protein [Lachnospiraceae bacterium]
MRNRDKWIAIAFLIFIFTLPLVTVVRNFMPQPEKQLTDEEKAILENNGTSAGVNAPDESETQTGDVVPEAVVNEPLFTKLQNGINNFTDNLFLRTKLISFNTDLTALLTGGTYIESTQVLMGKNNMLFYKTEFDGHPPIWDYMGIDHFSDEQLEMIAANLVATKAHLESKGIDFYVMCMPNKEIVYEENMPDTIARVSEVSRGEQLAEYMEENTDLVFVYPKNILIEKKKEAQLYYLTDTHCNQKGSFVAMQELFKSAYGTYSELDDVSFTADITDYVGDLAYLAGLADKFNIDTVYSFQKESADSKQYNDQVLLFVGDSFGGFLSTVCKGYYKEVYWEHPDQFEYGMYEEYDPDVVILERAERYCDRLGDPILINKYQ